MERENREKIVLWRKPLITLQYFVLELIITIQEYWKRSAHISFVKLINNNSSLLTIAAIFCCKVFQSLIF